MTTMNTNSLGLSNLLTLELEENGLHDNSVSPLAFQPLESILELQLDSNLFRSLPQGLPPSLQVSLILSSQFRVCDSDKEEEE